MITLGNAVIQGGSVVLSPPVGGFGGIEGVRIANYTGGLLVMSDITGDSQGSQQYVLPFQQAVYKVHNVRRVPTISDQTLGVSFDTQAVLIEWSDDPLNDFPGQYPVALTQAQQLATGNKGYNLRVTGGTPPTLNYHGDAFDMNPPTISNTVLHVIATDQRLAATIVNEGAVDINYSAFQGYDNGAYTVIYAPTGGAKPGASLTIGNGSHIQINADMTDPGVVFSIFGEATF